MLTRSRDSVVVDPCERQHPFGIGGKDLKGRGVILNMFISLHLRSQCLIVCGSSLQKGYSGFVEESRKLAYTFSRGVWLAKRRTRMLSTLQSLDQQKPPYNSVVRALAGCGSVGAMRMRDLADALEVGLGGLLVTEAVVLASVSASSLPGNPIRPGTHRRVVS